MPRPTSHYAPSPRVSSGALEPSTPSDGGRSARYSLSGSYATRAGEWSLRATAYLVHQRLTLWNDFTHFLDDPLNGDQHAQNDRRTFVGGALSASREVLLAGLESTFTAGVQARYDVVDVDLIRTTQREPLAVDRRDHVRETSVAGYLNAATHWTPWLRSVIAVREDFYDGNDRAIVGGVSGSEHAALFQPKGSLKLGPWAKTELYLSAGRGFHSNDVRAGPVDDGDGTRDYRRSPLLVRSTGYEIGARTSAIRGLTAAATLFRIDFDSELTYNADAGATEAGRPSRRTGIECPPNIVRCAGSS